MCGTGFCNVDEISVRNKPESGKLLLKDIVVGSEGIPVTGKTVLRGGFGATLHSATLYLFSGGESSVAGGHALKRV